MGDLSAELLAELQARPSKALWLLKLNWWDGTQLVADVGQASRTDGFYRPLIRSWGEVSERAVDPENNLQDVTFSVTMSDPTREIQNRVARREPIFNTTCELLLSGSTDVPRAGWSTRFSGFLDSIKSQRRGEWELSFRGLNSFIGDTALTTILAVDWPSAPTESLNLTVPMIWGRLAGAGYPEEAQGAVKAFLVDTVGFRYLVARGRVEVTAVYIAGVGIAFITTGVDGFTVTYPIVAGEVHTVIDFLNSQGTDEVTCDVVGYDTNGDGTGTVIEAPGDLIDDVLKKTLSPTGASIIATPLPIPDRLHAYGAFYLNAKQTGVQLVSALGFTFGLYPFLRGDGKVAFARELEWEDDATDLLSARRLPRSEMMGEPDQTLDGQDVAAGQLVVYGKRPSGGEAIEVLTGDALSRAGAAAVDQVQAQMLAVLHESEPDAVSPLVSWVEAWTLPMIEDQATLGASRRWVDLSDTGNDWAAGTGVGGAPSIRRSAVNGLPAVSFDGVGNFMVGPNQNVLQSANWTMMLVAKVRSVGTDNADASVTNDAIYDGPNNTTGLYLRSSGNAIARSEPPAGGSVVTRPWLVNQFQIFVLTHVTGAAQLLLGVNEHRRGRMGTVAAAGTTVSGNPVRMGVNMAGLATGTAFADVEVAAGVWHDDQLSDISRAIVFQILASRYLRYPTEGLARAIGARREMLRRALRSRVSVRVPLDWLDVPIMGQVNVEDQDVAGVTGSRPTERRPFVLAQRTTRPGTEEVGVQLIDAAEGVPSLWISCRAREGDPERFPGLSVYPNVQLEYAQLPDPAVPQVTVMEAPHTDQGLVEGLFGRPQIVGGFNVPIGGFSTDAAVPFWVPGGIVLTSQYSNTQSRSSGIAGVAGLVLAGGGITADTADLMLPDTISPSSLRLIVTGGLNQDITFPAHGYETPHAWLTLDYKSDTGHFLEVRVSRTSDGAFFNAATGFFQAGSVFNKVEAYAGHVASRTRGRFFLRRIPLAVNNGLIALVRLPSVHGNGARAHVYHLNFSSVNPPSVVLDGYVPRQPRNTVAFLNGDSVLRLDNGPAGENLLWPSVSGTMLATLSLMYGSAHLSKDHWLVELVQDAARTHYWRAGIEFNSGSPRFAFLVRGGAGAEVSSLVPLPAFEFGDTMRFVCRWTGSQEELGLPANTITAYVQRIPKFDRAGAIVQAGSAIATGNNAVCMKPVSTIASSIMLGGLVVGGAIKALDSHLNGLLQDLVIFPRAMTDEEIARRG